MAIRSFDFDLANAVLSVGDHLFTAKATTEQPGILDSEISDEVVYVVSDLYSGGTPDR